MNAQQLNAALALSLAEALKSCVRKEIDPAQIIGILEMHKSAILAHITDAQQRETIIQMHPPLRVGEKRPL